MLNFKIIPTSFPGLSLAFYRRLPSELQKSSPCQCCFLRVLCLALLPVTVIRHWLKEIQGVRRLFSLWVAVHHAYVRAGTQSRSCEGMLSIGLLPLATFLIHAVQDDLPRDGTSHKGWALLHKSAIQTLFVQRQIRWRQVFTWDVLFPAVPRPKLTLTHSYCISCVFLQKDNACDHTHIYLAKYCHHYKHLLKTMD